MNRRTYKAIPVNKVDVSEIISECQRRGLGEVCVGLDISKHDFYAVFHYAAGSFSQPIRVLQPAEIGAFVALLSRIQESLAVKVGLESTGTYGDALRWSLHSAGFEVQRISGKSVTDYAEIFDGVPSKHDGKDAAIIAELMQHGKGAVWPWKVNDERDRKMAHAVEKLDIQTRLEAMWMGRLEASLARHWPEVINELTLASATLAFAVNHYGRPQHLAADERASERLRGWGRGPLKQEKIDRIIESAKATVGVPMSDEDVAWLREIVTAIQHARTAQKACQNELKTLVSQNETIQKMATAVGHATACVLWVQLGDPRNYPAAGAYLKAAGLNLKVRSSGKMKGQLRISRRGPSRVRRWMYFAALRAVQKPSVKPWFDSKKAKNEKAGAMLATVGVMRKLMRAIWHITNTDDEFQWQLLFPGRPIVCQRKAHSPQTQQQ